MNKTFLNQENPLLTVMLQCETPDVAIRRIRNANCLGADAYGLQVESLKPEYQNPDTYKRILKKFVMKRCETIDWHLRGHFQNEIDTIDKMVRENNLKYSDFAVLFRTNAQARAIEEVFMRKHTI